MVALEDLQALVSLEQAECHQRMAASHGSCGGSSTVGSCGGSSAGSCSDIGSSNNTGQGSTESFCADLQLSPSLAGEAKAFAAALGSGAASAEQCEPLAGASEMNSSLDLPPSLADEARGFAATLGGQAAPAGHCGLSDYTVVASSCLDLPPNLAEEAKANALAWSGYSIVASDCIDLPPSLADEARAFALDLAGQVSSVEVGGLLVESDVTGSCIDLPFSLTEEARTFAMALESQAGPRTMLLGSSCSSGSSASPAPSTDSGASSSCASPVGSSGGYSGCSSIASSISTSGSLELASTAWSGVSVRQAARLSLSSSSGGSGGGSSGGSSVGDWGAADRDSLALYQAFALSHPFSSCSSSTGGEHALDLDVGMSDWSLELIASAVGDLFEAEVDTAADSLPLFQASAVGHPHSCSSSETGVVHALDLDVGMSDWPSELIASAVGDFFEAEDDDTAGSLPLYHGSALGHPLSCSSSAGIVQSMDLDAGMSDWSFEFSRASAVGGLFGAEGDTVAARLSDAEACSTWLLMQCGSSEGQGAYHDDAWEQGHGQGMRREGCGEAKEAGGGGQDEDRAQEHLLAAKERELLLLLDEEEEQHQGLLEEYDAMAWLASGPSFELPSAAALRVSDLTGVGSSRSSDGGASQTSDVLSQASSLSLHCWARARIAAARGTVSSCGGDSSSGSTAGSCGGSSDGSDCGGSSLGSLCGSAGAGCNSMQLSSCGGASERSWGSGVSSARSSSSQADSLTSSAAAAGGAADGTADGSAANAAPHGVAAHGAAVNASAYANLAAATLDLEAFLPMGLLETCTCLASGHDVTCSERDTLYGLSSSARAGMTGADFARVFLTTWLGGGPLPSSQLAEQLLERCLLE